MSEELAILMTTVGAILVVLFFGGLLCLALDGIRRIPLGLGENHPWAERFFGTVELIGAATVIDVTLGRHEWLTLFAIAFVFAVIGTMIYNHEDHVTAEKMARIRRGDESSGLHRVPRAG